MGFTNKNIMKRGPMVRNKVKKHYTKLYPIILGQICNYLCLVEEAFKSNNFGHIIFSYQLMSKKNQLLDSID